MESTYEFTTYSDELGFTGWTPLVSKDVSNYIHTMFRLTGRSDYLSIPRPESGYVALYRKVQS